MDKHIPVEELHNRMQNFRQTMDCKNPDWEIVLIFTKINQYYLTGTMQDGMLIIPRNDPATFWVRQSVERALDESLFPNIREMNSYRDAAATLNNFPETVYLETEKIPIAMMQRIQKYFPFKRVESMDMLITSVRAIKSTYELSLIERAGKIHQRILEQRVPEFLKEGMHEAELATKIFSVMVEEGHHGVARFGMFDTDIVLGHVAFGESSIYPTYFNGPGGNYGMSAAVPFLGSREKSLKFGDLVYIDIGCGVEGYHTDKTTTYCFGKTLPDFAVNIHRRCVDLQNEIAEQLKPGNTPEDIYNRIMNGLDADFMQNFMGFGQRKVKFLGHGVGLLIDELPVIAQGFTEPIQEGMVFAIEPKKGIPGIGMVGIENTFLVTQEGGRCLTGNHPGLILV